MANTKLKTELESGNLIRRYNVPNTYQNGHILYGVKVYYDGVLVAWRTGVEWAIRKSSTLIEIEVETDG